MKLRAAVGASLFLCVVAQGWPDTATASWPTNGLALGNGFRSQEVVGLVPSDAHSVCVVRVPMVQPGPDGLHAHRLTSGGTAWPNWPDTGIAFAPNLVGFAHDASVCSDAAGGIFVVWIGATESRVSNVFITRIGADGGFPAGWSSAGKQIGSGAGFDITPRVAPDGNGGAIAVWSRVAAPPSYPIVALRVTAEGLTAASWPDTGRWLCGTPGLKMMEELIPDGEGGAIAAWTNNSLIGLQRVASTGAIAAGWPADGILAGTGPPTQSRPQLAPGTGGTFYVGWSDSRESLTTPRSGPYLLHIESNSAIGSGWPSDGLRLSVPDASLWDLAPAQGGDVYAAWTSDGLRVQRVTADAQTSPGWPATAVAVSSTPSARGIDARLVPHSDDGVLVTWTSTLPPSDIYAQWVRAAGALDPSWPLGGVPVCLDPEVQERPFIASDGLGGAFVAWLDDRNEPASGEVFAQRVGPEGLPGSTVSAGPVIDSGRLRLSAPSPNPSAERARVELNMPEAATVSATVVDVGGRTVRRLWQDAALEAGRNTIVWDGLDEDGNLAAAGIYFIHVHSAQGVGMARVARLR